jgi:hypothetical protein
VQSATPIDWTHWCVPISTLQVLKVCDQLQTVPPTQTGFTTWQKSTLHEPDQVTVSWHVVHGDCSRHA